jgi:hypothetical protein
MVPGASGHHVSKEWSKKFNEETQKSFLFLTNDKFCRKYIFGLSYTPYLRKNDGYIYYSAALLIHSSSIFHPHNPRNPICHLREPSISTSSHRDANLSVGDDLVRHEPNDLCFPGSNHHFRHNMLFIEPCRHCH